MSAPPSAQKCVYVLELMDNNWYVGLSAIRCLEERLRSHFAGTGCAWTKLHAPLRCVERILNGDTFLENSVTKKYMHKYGIAKVRGGSYCTLVIPSLTVGFLERELNTGCYYCRSEGHFANDCPLKRINTINKIHAHQVALICKRCFRHGHVESRCYAQTDFTGNTLVSNDVVLRLQKERERMEASVDEVPSVLHERAWLLLSDREKEGFVDEPVAAPVVEPTPGLLYSAYCWLTRK
jgi:hypothetical protein